MTRGTTLLRCSAGHVHEGWVGTGPADVAAKRDDTEQADHADHDDSALDDA